MENVVVAILGLLFLVVMFILLVQEERDGYK